VLTDEHIEKIIGMFDSKADVAHVAVAIDNAKIADNDYNLSASAYVAAKDKSEKVDIVKLNAAISTTVEKINELRMSIDEIVHEIESTE